MTNLHPDSLVVVHAVETVDRDCSPRWLHQGRDDLRERGFSGTVPPDQSEYLAPVHVERDIAKSFYRGFCPAP